MNKNPTRILIVDGKMICGGVESFIMNIYRHIDRTKLQFDFLVHYREKFFYDDEIEKLGGRIYRLTFRNDNRLVKYKHDLKAFFLAHPEYRIVWGHMDGLASIYLKIAKKQGVSMTIAHSHITNAEQSFKGLIKRVLRRNISKWADKRFACSSEAGRYLYGKHLFELIPNAIEVEKFQFSEAVRHSIREQNSWEDKYVIGHIGRFNAQKNHRYLIDIFCAYAANHADAVLCLCGDGENRSAIETYVATLNLTDRVIFTGNITNANEYYQAFDLFVMPSLYEGLPVSGVEAQTAGLKCLFADTITRETAIVPGLTAFFPINTDADVWATKIEQVRKEDNSDRAEAYRIVEGTKYNIKTLSRQLQDFFVTESGKGCLNENEY